VTRLHACLEAGRWLDPSRPGEVIVGHTLAENLAVRLGERVVLTAQRPAGEMASEVFRLGGVLCPSDPERDRTLAIVGLPCAQPWLGLGAGVTDVVLRVASHAQAAAVRDRLRERLPADRYEVLAWDDLDPMARQWLRFNQAYGWVVLLVVTALAVGQVLNALLMVLHERTPELGLLTALGLRARQLAGLVLVEGLLLVAIGGLTGFAVGAALVHGLAAGIDLSRFSAALGFFHVSPVVRPVLGAGTVAVVLITLLAAALLASGYPAAKASRIEPMRALRRL
jgi:ABC-type lipoprotein release transport system permease subunit